MLNKRDFSDLQFSLATSYLLEGSPEFLGPAKDLYKEALLYDDPFFSGFVLNNLGMANWYDFVI